MSAGSETATARDGERARASRATASAGAGSRRRAASAAAPARGRAPESAAASVKPAKRGEDEPDVEHEERRPSSGCVPSVPVPPPSPGQSEQERRKRHDGKPEQPVARPAAPDQVRADDEPDEEVQRPGPGRPREPVGAGGLDARAAPSGASQPSRTPQVASRPSRRAAHVAGVRDGRLAVGQERRPEEERLSHRRTARCDQPLDLGRLAAQAPELRGDDRQVERARREDDDDRRRRRTSRPSSPGLRAVEAWRRERAPASERPAARAAREAAGRAASRAAPAGRAPRRARAAPPTRRRRRRTSSPSSAGRSA